MDVKRSWMTQVGRRGTSVEGCATDRIPPTRR